MCIEHAMACFQRALIGIDHSHCGEPSSRLHRLACRLWEEGGAASLTVIQVDDGCDWARDLGACTVVIVLCIKLPRVVGNHLPADRQTGCEERPHGCMPCQFRGLVK